MGLKSGSRDAGLDDSEEESESDRSADVDVDQSSPDPQTTESAERDTGRADTDARPSMDAIPYKLRREKVNEGREQVPFFLRETVVDGEDDLRDALEEALGEDVYKSDYREAAMVVAQRHPDLVAEVLREWGYDLD